MKISRIIKTIFMADFAAGLLLAIKKDQKIRKFLDGNNIIRSIFVKNKLINLIIK